MQIKVNNPNILLEVMELGPLGTNCYILTDKPSKLTAVIDPGGNPEAVERYLQEIQGDLVYIINTHGHWDHVGANQKLQQTTHAKLYIHEADAYRLQEGVDRLFGVQIPVSIPDDFLADGQTIELGDIQIKVIYTPGHSEGGVCLLLDDEILISGDTLFQHSIGRTDLPGGDFDTIINSIKDKLLPLTDDVLVLPGHGPGSTIGAERKHNPYIRE